MKVKKKKLYDFVSPPIFSGIAWKVKNHFFKMVEKRRAKTIQFRYFGPNEAKKKSKRTKNRQKKNSTL